MDLNELHSKYRNKEITEDEMFEGCINVIHHAVHKSSIKHTEDRFQEGCISALYCIRNYKGNENYSLSTMIYKKVKWGMIKYSWSDRLIVKPFSRYLNKKDRDNFTVVSDEGINVIQNDTISEDVITVRQTVNEIKEGLMYDIINLKLKGYSIKNISSILKVNHNIVNSTLRDIEYTFRKSVHLSRDPSVSFTGNEIRIIKANPNIRSYELAEVLNKPILDVYKIKTRLKGGNK